MISYVSNFQIPSMANGVSGELRENALYRVDQTVAQ